MWRMVVMPHQLVKMLKVREVDHKESAVSWAIRAA